MEILTISLVSFVSLASFSTCWFSLIYSYFKLFNNLPEKNRKRVCEFIPGLLHASLISPLAIYFFFTEDAEILRNNLYGYSSLIQYYMSISLGFFIYDMSIGFIKNNYIFILHGVISSTLCICIMYPFNHYMAAVFLLFEISSIPYNIRMIMIYTNSANGFKYNVIQLLFISSFMGIRICLGIPLSIYAIYDIINLIYLGQQHSTTQCIMIVVSSTLLNCLNIYWTYGIVKKIIYTYQLYKSNKLNKTINN